MAREAQRGRLARLAHYTIHKPEDAMSHDDLLAAVTACNGSYSRAAAQLGLNVSTLRYRIQYGDRQPSAPRTPDEHPASAALVAEMERLRFQTRLLVRRPGPHSAQELLHLEARHRQLRELLRRAMGAAEATDTRERSSAAAGMVGAPHGTWHGQR